MVRHDPSIMDSDTNIDRIIDRIDRIDRIESPAEALNLFGH